MGCGEASSVALLLILSARPCRILTPLWPLHSSQLRYDVTSSPAYCHSLCCDKLSPLDENVCDENFIQPVRWMKSFLRLLILSSVKEILARNFYQFLSLMFFFSKTTLSLLIIVASRQSDVFRSFLRVFMTAVFRSSDYLWR